MYNKKTFKSHPHMTEHASDTKVKAGELEVKNSLSYAVRSRPV